MKLSGLLIFSALVSSNLVFSGVNSINSLSVTDEQQFNEEIREVKNIGLRPTDENVYSIYFASSMLFVNAVDNAVSDQFVGDE